MDRPPKRHVPDDTLPALGPARAIEVIHGRNHIEDFEELPRLGDVLKLEGVEAPVVGDDQLITEGRLVERNAKPRVEVGRDSERGIGTGLKDRSGVSGGQYRPRKCGL